MRATSFFLFLALGLAGCPGGSETPEPSPTPESTPAPVVEATPASDDDDSAGSAGSDDDDSAASAEVAAAVEAPAEGEAGDATEEVASEASTPAEPPPPPREEGVDPPYDVTLIGVARDSDTTGVFSVSVRGEADTIKDIKWTVPAGFKGPVKTEGKEDSIYAWTISGLGKGLVKGSVVAKLDKWTRNVAYELPALEEPPPPSPPEDPAPAKPAPE